MHLRTWAPLALITLSLAARPAAAIPGFQPARGWVAEDLRLQADTFGVAPDGRLAIGLNGPAGATIVVYNHSEPAGRRALARVTAPGLRTLGGLAFASRDVVLASENGGQGTVFAVNLRNGRVAPLAPPHSIPNAAQVRVRPRDGAVFVVAANQPGQGAIYRIANGQAVPFATGLGRGYLGGVAFDRLGNLFTADTNDPFFMGEAGRILAVSPAGDPFAVVSLAGGGGAGAYDVAMDRWGVLYSTTGATVTACHPGLPARSLGTFTGDYPFPTDIAIDPHAGVLVNGLFTGVGGIFRIRRAPGTPVPSPLP